jgi:hypothetical protein
LNQYQRQPKKNRSISRLALAGNGKMKLVKDAT